MYESETLIINGYICTKQETLAFANLLIPDYAQIVRAARNEQRNQEARKEQETHREKPITRRVPKQRKAASIKSRDFYVFDDDGDY